MRGEEGLTRKGDLPSFRVERKKALEGGRDFPISLRREAIEKGKAFSYIIEKRSQGEGSRLLSPIC